LPEADKEPAKKQFLAYGMVKSARDVLLGNSRLDISTLIATKAMVENAKPQAKAYFFLPLSLLCGAGAYINLYAWESKGVSFGPTRIDGMTELDVFSGVQTRYGLISMARDQIPTFPIRFIRHTRTKCHLMTLDRLYDNIASPFLVGHSIQEITAFRDLLLALNLKNIEPARQGVNTCGANDILIFDECKNLPDGTSMVSNKVVSGHVETSFLYLLHHTKSPRNRWVLIPHDTTSGRPLKEKELQKYPLLTAYLKKHQKTLQKRKGLMIQSFIKRKYWWALLGVGAYSFAPYKVIWQAYGTNNLLPEVVKGTVQ